MLADDRDDRPRENPLACALFRIIIVNGAAGRVPAVDRGARRTVGRVRDGRIDAAVGQAAERAGLVDHAGERVGKARVLNAVENHSGDRDLAFIRLAARFRRDHAREQVEVRVGKARDGAAALARADAQRLQRSRTRNAVGGQALLFLKLNDGRLCLRTENAVDVAGVQAALFEFRFNLRDFIGTGTELL